MEIIQVKDYQEMSKKASEIIEGKINLIDKPVLGLATGSSPEGMYECLIDKYKKGEISFQNTTTFNLDEYIDLSKDNSNSYYYYMHDKLFNHIDIKSINVHLLKGMARDLREEALRYERMIRDAGGIDLQVLGIGVNGHIGFNEPGTKFTNRTGVVELNELTRQANLRHFQSLDQVPTHAITMGIETIMDSKEILLLAFGKEKSRAVKGMIHGDVDEHLPASVLQKHQKVTIIADEAALSNV